MKISIGKGGGELRERLDAKRKAKRRGSGVTKRAKGGKAGTVIGVLFFFIFFAAGSAFGWFMFAKPGIKLLDAQNWPAVPATVTSSGLDAQPGSEGGTTYRIEISFAYEFNGRRYTSDTYDFFSFIGSSGYDGKRKVVDAHPVGRRTTCYVDPDDPTVAVLSRGWSHNLWFGAIPLVFVLVGGGGMIGMFWKGSRASWTTKHAKRSDAEKSDYEETWLPKYARPSERIAPDGQTQADLNTVSPTTSRWGKLGFVILFMAIWDGVLAIILYNVFKDGLADNWGTALFMIPFVLVGIGAFIALIYMVLAMSNPVVRMRFEPRVIPRGEPLKVSWTIDGRAERIQKLILTVEGVERATYTRGTDTITDEHVFYEHTLYEAEAMDRRDPLAREGEAELELPADAMHSLEADHNKVVWRMKVKGEIPKWPDVKDDYEFAVVPPLHDGPNPRGMF